jgi:Domain of unknown function (DUF5642)
MRVVACSVLVLLCAACGGPGPAPKPPSTAAARAADPAGIDRIRNRLPADYEIASLPKPPMPVTFWGIAPGWSSDPAACGALTAVGRHSTTWGWAASGSGGIVYALVATGPAPSPEVLDGCATWTFTGGRTTAAATLGDGPQISGTQTVAMTADVTTSVENGTETHSHAITLASYTDDLVVSVTVVTDPGSQAAALPEQLPAQLLGAAVQAIRGADDGNR